jgi:hypothetical protein
VRSSLFILLFLPALLIGQKHSSTFKGTIDFNVNTKIKVNKPYLTYSNYKNSLTIKQANIFSYPKYVNFYNIENSLLLESHNNIFYQRPIFNSRVIDNQTLDFFVELTIETLRVIGTPQISFCP